MVVVADWWLGDCEYDRVGRAQIDRSKVYTSKITDRKLNGDNYLQWKKIVEINFTGHRKKSYLYTDPPSSKTDKWQ